MKTINVIFKIDVRPVTDFMFFLENKIFLLYAHNINNIDNINTFVSNWLGSPVNKTESEILGQIIFSVNGNSIKLKNIKDMYNKYLIHLRKSFYQATFKNSKTVTETQMKEFFDNKTFIEVFDIKHKEHVENLQALQKSLTPYEPVYQLEKIASSMALSHKKPGTLTQLNLPFGPITADPGFFELIIGSITSQDKLKTRLSEIMVDPILTEKQKDAASLYIKGNLLMGQSIGIDCYLWLKRSIVGIKADSKGNFPAIVGEFTSFTQLSKIITGFDIYSNEIESVFYFLSKVNFDFQDTHKERKQSLLWLDYNLNNAGFRLHISNRLIPGFTMPERDRKRLSSGDRFLKLHVPLPENIPVYSNKGASLQKITAIFFNSWLTQKHAEFIAKNGYFPLEINSIYQYLVNMGFSMDKRTLQKIVNNWIKQEYIVPEKKGYRLGDKEVKSWNYIIDTGKLIVAGKTKQSYSRKKKK